MFRLLNTKYNQNFNSVRVKYTTYQKMKKIIKFACDADLQMTCVIFSSTYNCSEYMKAIWHYNGVSGPYSVPVDLKPELGRWILRF